MITIWEHYPAQDCRTYAPIALPVLEDDITEVIYCPFCRDIFIQVTVAGLQSGESVSGRVEGSLDGVGWDNLAADQLDTNVTVNGTTLASYTGALPPYIRVVGFTDASGEATITIQFHIASMV